GPDGAGQPGSGSPTNAVPLAVADVAVQDGGVLDLPVLLNDSDPDDDPIAIVAVTQPGHGTVEAATSTVRYTPEPGFLGEDAFTYTIDDGRGGQGTATVRIGTGRAAPRLTPDQATVAPAASVTIAVLANDLDLAGGALRLTGIGTPSAGTAAIDDSGTPGDSGDDVVIYTAPAGFTGTDTFTYGAANAAGMAESRVTVTVTDPSVSAPPSNVGGRAVKGPLRAATVALYALDARGERIEPPLTEAMTDSDGRWSAVLPADHGNVLIVTDGGAYSDESDPSGRTIELGTGNGLAGVLPAGESEASVSVFTDAVYRKARFETQGDNFAAVFAGNRADAESAFGFDLVSTLPADPAAPEDGMSEDALRYALALGGAANAINELAVYVGLDTPTYPVIDAFVEDFAECVLNGEGLRGPVRVAVDGAALDLPPRLDLNLAIVRFRNNLADRYGPLLTQVDTNTCSRPGFLPDAVAPVFTAVPGPVTINAVSAAGTPVSSSDVAAILNAPLAADDRDGALAVSNDAPAVLPLGTTPVTFFATDAGGNRAEATVPVTVADLSPPALTVPADLTVTAIGRVTAVTLGDAVAVDNVSAAGAITITNDAPALGFAPGTTTVTWTAVDAAGLATTARQLVTVTSSGSPTLDSPVADVTATEDVLLSLRLADAFDVSGAPSPRFSLSGLPPGSGLAFDGNSGTLRGTPNDADVLAAPLTLTVTATNDDGSASDTFVLTVQNVNDAPVIATVPVAVATAGTAYRYDFAGTDADPGEALRVSAPVLPAWLSLVDNRDGTATLAGMPAPGDAGSYPVELELADAAGAVATQSFTVVVAGSADVSLSLVVSNAAPAPGDVVVVTLTAANAGPSDAAGVVVDGLAATGYHLLTASGAFDFEDFVWTVGPIAAGDSASLVVQAEVKDAGDYAFTAQVSAALYDDPDSTPGNDSETEDDYAVVATSPVGGDPDSDGDGVTDADETGVFMTDPTSADSDGDGVEDRIEILVDNAGTLANAPASRVLYVDPTAAPGGDGSSWTLALRTTAELAPLLASGTSGDPLYVLLSAADQARYAPLTISHDHVVIAGVLPSGAPLVPGRALATFDAQGADSAALTADGAANVTLVNLLLTGGLPTGRGGGLHVDSGSAVAIHDSIIAGNDAGDAGGGFAVEAGASLTLTDTQVYSNTARGNGGGGGFAAGSLDARNAIFADNIQWSGGSLPGGGGLALIGNAASTVSDSLFVANFSSNDGGGLYATAIAGPTTLHNNLIAGNANVNGFGGGVHVANVVGTDTVSLSSSTVVYNQTAIEVGSGAQAGGVDLAGDADSVLLSDTVAWFNADADSAAESNDNVVSRGAAAIAFNNAGGFGGAGVGGNLDADPVFLEGFYLHQTSSPSVDAGSQTAAAAGLAAPYSTAVTGAGDAGLLDQGFH
ncbi:MAG: Ig-like domain-containing protein, partial [Pseudomonadota bacterium]